MSLSLTQNTNLGSALLSPERPPLLDMGPPWFRHRQTQAWERFRTLPYPRRHDERWRFSTVAGLEDIERFSPAPLEGGHLDAIYDRPPAIESPAGRLVFCDDNLAGPRYLAPGLEERGVVFTTLIDALNRHPALLERYFMRHTPDLGSDKFEALHLALLRAGVILYLPPDLQIDEPFIVENWTRRAHGATFPHTLFIGAEGSRATLLELQDHLDPHTDHLVVANTHLIGHDRAHLHHILLQNWNLRTRAFQLNTSTAHARTHLKSIAINLGSRAARQEMHGRIFGSDANVEMLSLGLVHGEQELDQRTLQTHIAPGSRSDLLFKNALAGSSRTIFSGLIIVKENAQKTDAYQKNSNLMLSDDAEANSLPGLEIGANDVRCTHGATTGKIDPTNLFYFLARGIPRPLAEQLLAFGFLDDIAARIDHPALAARARALLEQRLAHLA